MLLFGTPYRYDSVLIPHSLCMTHAMLDTAHDLMHMVHNVRQIESIHQMTHTLHQITHTHIKCATQAEKCNAVASVQQLRNTMEADKNMFEERFGTTKSLCFTAVHVNASNCLRLRYSMLHLKFRSSN